MTNYRITKYGREGDFERDLHLLDQEPNLDTWFLVKATFLVHKKLSSAKLKKVCEHYGYSRGGDAFIRLMLSYGLIERL